MVTWKDFYAERQRRADQIERGQRRREMAEQARRAALMASPTQTRTPRFKTVTVKLKAALRRRPGLHPS
ncbi:MAG TPA: hypothetical protein VK879_18720 [Candidatus Sulfomarinibacteraceae bacterium]|nr:hypothetical protein [Candidatus Sulfomarinibacteraceae bacterium]